MFLAINELLKEKTRFSLIIVVIILVGYLTFFLTGLAYGLATSYTQGIDKWNASGIVLQNDANNNIGRSILVESDYEGLAGDDAALLGVGNATIKQAAAEDVSLFGVDMDSFLAPNITEGRAVEAENELVVSDKLKDSGVEVGDTLRFKGASSDYRVVGITDRSTFQTAPIVYMQLQAWRDEASEIAGMTAMRDNTTVSAIVTKQGDVPEYNTDRMSWQSIRDFSFQLPGYNAQVLTFSLMIGFLIAIASFVLAIFIYVLTIQKKSMFGVLKAEGIPNRYIVRSVMIQVFILLIAGLAIGLALTMLTTALLGSKVPFLVSPWFFGGIVLLFMVFSAIGGLASVRAVTKIDPVKAIG